MAGFREDSRARRRPRVVAHITPTAPRMHCCSSHRLIHEASTSGREHRLLDIRHFAGHPSLAIEDGAETGYDLTWPGNLPSHNHHCCPRKADVRRSTSGAQPCASNPCHARFITVTQAGLAAHHDESLRKKAGDSIAFPLKRKAIRCPLIEGCGLPNHCQPQGQSRAERSIGRQKQQGEDDSAYFQTSLGQ